MKTKETVEAAMLREDEAYAIDAIESDCRVVLVC